MKNQYFGDVNDYRKYGLLRIVASGLKLGVCWMLTPGDGKSDGKFIQYLDKTAEWKAYDPQLYDLLKKSVQEKRRNVGQAKLLRLLPNAVYCETLFSEDFTELSGRDLIFFDPDNGLEVKSVPRGRKDSSKYLYWAELLRAFQKGHSIIVYQHFPREKREPFIERMKAEIRKRLCPATVFAFRTPKVVFLLAVQHDHLSYFREKIAVLQTKWPAKQISVI